MLLRGTELLLLSLVLESSSGTSLSLSVTVRILFLTLSTTPLFHSFHSIASPQHWEAQLLLFERYHGSGKVLVEAASSDFLMQYSQGDVSRHVSSGSNYSRARLSHQVHLLASQPANCWDAGRRLWPSKLIHKAAVRGETRGHASDPPPPPDFICKNRWCVTFGSCFRVVDPNLDLSVVNFYLLYRILFLFFRVLIIVIFSIHFLKKVADTMTLYP